MTAPKFMRIWFLVFAMIIVVGIYLTGFGNVHWFMYVPLVILVFAAVTGICPGQIGLKKMLGDK